MVSKLNLKGPGYPPPQAPLATSPSWSMAFSGQELGNGRVWEVWCALLTKGSGWWRVGGLLAVLLGRGSARRLLWAQATGWADSALRP